MGDVPGAATFHKPQTYDRLVGRSNGACASATIPSA
jgi:hypothetical protein